VPSYFAFDYLLKNYDLLVVFLLLIMIWAADVGAYFAGKGFGKTKLAAKVSPGKTREGAVGGLILSLAVALLGAVFLLGLHWEQALKYFLVIGLCVIASSVIGDLTVSMFKRNANLKDSGVFLPGHGGVMDRIDSLCAGVVFYSLGMYCFKPLLAVT
jgi:phosphatidate cytidylyltransferase